MQLTFITYNTLYNRALEGVKEIINKYQPDIICLQEIKTDEKNLLFLENDFLKLADFSNYSLKENGTFGMATFYNKKTLRFLNSGTIPLKKTILDFIFSFPNLFKQINLNRKFLKTEFIFKKSVKKIIVYNTHLTLYGSNKTKLNQLKLILNESKKIKNSGIIIAGDFNYFPYGRKKLEDMMKTYGFKEATSNITYTIKYRNLKQFYYSLFFRMIAKIYSKLFTDKLKIDYVFFKNIKLIDSTRIDIDCSDHYPIIIKFEI